MKIMVVGSSKNKFLKLNNIREKFFIDVKHNEPNIDFLNPWYCELTGLYYLWKNYKDDVVGLEHYRRYFVNDKDEILSEEEVNNLLSNYDVVCKKHIFKEHNQTTIYNWWTKGGNYNKLEKFVNCIEDTNLKNFMFDKIKTQGYYYHCNMFICKKELIDKYCDWLFNTLAKLDKKDFINSKRLCGYLAEYTFGFWLQYNNCKICTGKVKIC